MFLHALNAPPHRIPGLFGKTEIRSVFLAVKAQGSPKRIALETTGPNNV
jgi:hypothetical protein